MPRGSSYFLATMKTEKRTSRRWNLPRPRTLLAAIALLIATSMMAGCHGGTLFGAGIGALFGQAIGGDTESTVAGAIYGGMIGGAVESSHHQGSYYQASYQRPAYNDDSHHRYRCYDY